MEAREAQCLDCVALRDSTVNCCQALEADGLISRSSPRAVTIGDWKKLADAGDFDSGYLHMKQGDPQLA